MTAAGIQAAMPRTLTPCVNDAEVTRAVRPVPRADELALVAQGGGAEPRAGPEARGGVERHAEHRDVRVRPVRGGRAARERADAGVARRAGGVWGAVMRSRLVRH